METRTINQVKLYILTMNPITDRTESGRIAAMSYSKQALIDFYNQESVERYKDDNWSKFFRKGSLLEWLNPLHSFEIGHYGHGIREEWANVDSLENIKYLYQFV